MGSNSMKQTDNIKIIYYQILQFLVSFLLNNSFLYFYKTNQV